MNIELPQGFETEGSKTNVKHLCPLTKNQTKPATKKISHFSGKLMCRKTRCVVFFITDVWFDVQIYCSIHD